VFNHSIVTTFICINRHIQPPVCTLQRLNDHHHSLTHSTHIQLPTSIGSVPLHLHLPIGEESDFVGVIDLVADTAVIWRDEELGKDDDMMLVMMTMALRSYVMMIIVIMMLLMMMMMLLMMLMMMIDVIGDDDDDDDCLPIQVPSSMSSLSLKHLSQPH